MLFRPHVVFSKGGYVSLPVVLAASLLRIKTVLHESDSRMGMANRIAAKLASKVCVAFPDLERSYSKAVLTGNPIRHEILNGEKDVGYKLTGFNQKLPVILIWGGSQGAQQINELLLADFDNFVEHFQIVHIAGAGKTINKSHPHYKSYEYLGEELKDIYAITDMIVGRAGANSIYEVALLQKPNIIIPLTNADQLKNAHYFEEMGATHVYKNEENLFDVSRSLWQNHDLKSSMKQSLKKLSRPNAAADIASLLLSEIN